MMSHRIPLLAIAAMGLALAACSNDRSSGTAAERDARQAQQAADTATEVTEDRIHVAGNEAAEGGATRAAGREVRNVRDTSQLAEDAASDPPGSPRD